MNSVMIIGMTESFLIRSLIKKLKEEVLDAYYVPADVNQISQHFDTADLIAIYFDNTLEIPHKVLLYLKDQLSEAQKKFFLVGEKGEISLATDVIPEKLISQVFPRPLKPEIFVEATKRHLAMAKDENRRKTILIVDDDPTYIGLVRDWLKDEYTVAMVNSGAQAFRYLGQNYTDLILLDFEMPVVTGPEVLKMLRSDPDTSKIPVIFLTGKQDRQSVMEVVSLKPEGYILKSVDQEKLLFEIKKFFMERA